MITSPDNDKLKLVRRLRDPRARRRTGLFVAEGEDMGEAAAAAGVAPEVLLVAGVDVEASLLAQVSALGSGTRAVGVFEQRFVEPGGLLSVYLHGVADPGNVGATIRSAHALGDGPVILGPGCADPYGPKAVRASMGSVFARPPARSEPERLGGTLVALERGAGRSLAELEDAELEPPVTVCLGAERDGLPAAVRERVSLRAEIPLRPDGPDSLNVAMAATVALYELGRREVLGAGGTRMADHG
ncbi:MAG TPA: RNA methyltransferase [Thermoleophilaceae bacterium]|nr:RNA methyltransferase [Thermoleophilaceae bacterium]